MAKTRLYMYKTKNLVIIKAAYSETMHIFRKIFFSF